MRTWTLVLSVVAAIALLVAFGMLAALGRLTTPAAALLVVGVGALVAVVLLRAQDIAAALQGRGIVYGTGTALSVLLVLAILVFAYLFLGRYKKRLDWTEAGLYTLASQTVRVLESLEAPVHAVAMDRGASDAGSWERTKQVMELYAYAGGKQFTYEMVDPQKHPTKVDRYKEYISDYDTIPLVLITQEDEAGTLRVEKATSLEEEALTNAIIKLAKQAQRKAYFTVGHGERPLEQAPGAEQEMGSGQAMTAIKRDLEGQGYTVETVSTIEREDLPEDCDLLIVAGPQNDFMSHETAAIDRFLSRGGDLLLMLDPQSGPALAAWAGRRLGLVVGNDIVVEYNPVMQMFGGDPTQPIVQEFNADHEITKSLAREGARMVVRQTRSVQVADNPPAGMAADWLLRTSAEASWGETDWTRLREGGAGKDAADLAGPVPIGAAVVFDATDVVADTTDEVELAGRDRQARAVVYGSSNLIVDSSVMGQGTGPLVMNSVNWLAGHEDLIAIPAKDRRDTSVILSGAQLWTVFLVTCVGVPLLFLIAGIAVFVARRAAA